MKKLKMILTATAVLFVVGGALAFKSTTSEHRIFCEDSNGFCTLPQDGITTSNVGPEVSNPCPNVGDGSSNYGTTSSTTQPCQLSPVTFYSIQD
jgi:hypothetical protein